MYDKLTENDIKKMQAEEYPLRGRAASGLV